MGIELVVVCEGVSIIPCRPCFNPLCLVWKGLHVRHSGRVACIVIGAWVLTAASGHLHLEHEPKNVGLMPASDLIQYIEKFRRDKGWAPLCEPTAVLLGFVP